MTVRTKLTLQSGDRAALDRVVESIREHATRKGAELKGPHTDEPRHLQVPTYWRLDGDDGDRMDRWSYTVYSRHLEIRGNDEVARKVLDRTFPDSVHAELEFETIEPVGSA